jgi:hypothetical protein
VLHFSPPTEDKRYFPSGVERISPRKQGDLGELSAINWLMEQDYDVYLPLGHSPDYDMVADGGGALLRVQVKTSKPFRNRRWQIALRTCGGTEAGMGS